MWGAHAIKYDVTFASVGVASYVGADWLDLAFNHAPQVAACISIVFMAVRAVEHVYKWFKK